MVIVHVLLSVCPDATIDPTIVHPVASASIEAEVCIN